MFSIAGNDTAKKPSTTGKPSLFSGSTKPTHLSVAQSYSTHPTTLSPIETNMDTSMGSF